MERGHNSRYSVWIFNHYAVGPGVPGGTRHYDVGRELAKHGWRVTIFSGVYPHRIPLLSRRFVAEGVPVETHEGVSFVAVPAMLHEGTRASRVCSMLSYVLGAMKAVRGHTPPDIVVGSSVHPFAAWIAWRLARRMGCSYVFEIRDLWPESIIQLGNVSRRHPFIMLLSHIERVLVNHSDRIVSPLPNIHAYLDTLGVPMHRVAVVPNGVDKTRLDIQDAGLPSHLETIFDQLKDAFVVAYVGSHGLANRLDIVIDAAAKCISRSNRRVEFLFVGDGPEKPRLRQRVSELRLRNVTFVDKADKELVIPLLLRCNAGVIAWAGVPLYQYGISPNKLFDYMLAGLPVVMAGNSPNNPISNSGGA